MTSTVVLTDGQLAALADLVAGRVIAALDMNASTATPEASRLVDAQTLAEALGVSRRYVYEHREQLGAVALGDGAKPRLRFDVEAARTEIARSGSGRSKGENPSDDGRSSGRRRSRSPRLPNGLPKTGSVLAIRPRGGER